MNYYPGKCAYKVFIRDTYRRTGRGPTGFEMHYTERRCKRDHQPSSLYCWQHKWKERFDQPDFNPFNRRGA